MHAKGFFHFRDYLTDFNKNLNGKLYTQTFFYGDDRHPRAKRWVKAKLQNKINIDMRT